MSPQNFETNSGNLIPFLWRGESVVAYCIDIKVAWPAGISYSDRTYHTVLTHKLMPLERLLSLCSRFTLLYFAPTVTTDNMQNILENSFIILNGLLNAFCYRHIHNYTRD